MKIKKRSWCFITLVVMVSLILTACGSSKTSSAGSSTKKDIRLLNVSYDPTRELYKSYNQLFASYWKKKTGQNVTIQQSHGGSGAQARAVIDGLNADVVTLALAGDVNSIVNGTQKIAPNWQDRLPDHSAPYTSTIVFLVRKGNPKHIKDWDDLTKKGVGIVTPNPKTSGGARWNFLAAWAYADKKYNGDQTKDKQFLKALYKNVKVLDSGARGATTSFTTRGVGDVLIAWENEALLSLNAAGGKDKYDIVNPSISILTEPTVSVVDKNAQKNGTKKAATAYLKYLYTKSAQKIIAKNYYRPRNQSVLKNYRNLYPNIPLVKIDDPLFGGWNKAQKKFFDDGGIFDQIYTEKQ
ncbi:sulfate ABC transporter substrate-binding protein [Sporolactobacillus shoreicorticis]|uniref:Sulfate-binding protein n=1 Tax=Sporolactobacillus shoreicorticis TaxID=1923877 RepID=A0ABW5S404_9BACL|nr:sulfate ABC transporter substrate-binding protein [Sporolactobacillus shoreicorticis]MCO7127677.1 sulfate ABC transporter substrate-binding protein [Sporolactobacillus shoreicorticis]